jgi:uncharacterized protein
MMPDSFVSSIPPANWRVRLLGNTFIRITVAMLFIAIPFAIVATPFNLYVSDKTFKKAGALLLVVVILVAYSTYVRVVERRIVTELSTSRAFRELGAGCLLGAFLLTATIALLAALGVYQVTGTNGWAAAIGLVPAFVMSPVLEEVVMRGIVFRILEQRLGSWVALAISAVIFGLLHLFNQGATLLDACDVMIVGGVMLAAAFMLTRRLWLCIGMHFAWNFTQGAIFSAAVSGEPTRGLLQSRLVGPAYLTGGAFGAEASLSALGICATAGVLLLYAARRKGHVVPAPWAARSAVAPAS